MDENKNTPKKENKAVAPPMVKKEETSKTAPAKPQATNNKSKKTLAIVIPVACAVVVVLGIVGGIVFKNLKDKNEGETDPGIFVVTDENGVAVTDESGVPVTYVAETEYVNVTDANGSIVTDADGNNVTTLVYKEQEVTVNVKVTDENGEQVTNSKGEAVTKQEAIKQDPNKAEGDKVVLGTTAVAVTDGQGNTAVDNAGNLFTTIVELTSNPVTVEPAVLDWKASLGGTAEDYFSSIETDKDGNYIAANVTNSKDGQFKEYESLGYAAPYTVLVKYDKSGNIKWQKPIGHRRGTLQIMDILTNDDGTFYAIGYGKNVGGVNGRGYMTVPFSNLIKTVTKSGIKFSVLQLLICSTAVQ